MSELKPCPLPNCGGEAIGCKSDGDGHLWIECSKCGLTTRRYLGHERQALFTLWNARTDSDTVKVLKAQHKAIGWDAAIERLSGALDKMDKSLAHEVTPGVGCADCNNVAEATVALLDVRICYGEALKALRRIAEISAGWTDPDSIYEMDCDGLQEIANCALEEAKNINHVATSAIVALEGEVE